MDVTKVMLRLFKDDPFNSQRGATDLGEEGLRFFPAQKTQNDPTV